MLTCTPRASAPALSTPSGEDLLTADVSINWFLAQALGAAAAYLIGLGVGRRSQAWGEIAIAIIAALTIGWALRLSAQDALLRLIPLDFLVYTEGTLIVPFFMALAGIVGARCEKRGQKRAGPLLAAFGLLYFTVNASWMVAPRVPVAAPGVILLSDSVVLQTRSDTCVAAALATALRSPGVGIDTCESEMAALADVRAGHGATMLRALRAAQRRLTGEHVQANIHTCSAREAAKIGTRARPVLVTLRSGPLNTHMVAVLGLARTGDVLVANPASDPSLRPGLLPLGVSMMPMSDFARRYTGSAIVFTDRAPVRHAARR